MTDKKGNKDSSKPDSYQSNSNITNDDHMTSISTANPTPHKQLYLAEDLNNATPKYLTGWTPLISKYNNDQVITYSSPNNKILFQQLSAANNINFINTPNNHNIIMSHSSSSNGISNSANSNSHNVGNGITHNNNNHSNNSNPNNSIYGGMPSFSGDTDYTQGLSLTPFITHNLHSSITASGGALGQLTPFHDKSLNLTDFFVDSPLRQSPLNDLQTITPSKFKINSGRSQSVKQLIFENAKNGKRSINQVDTPPRPSQKVNVLEKSLQIAVQEDTEDESDGNEDKENALNGKNRDNTEHTKNTKGTNAKAEAETEKQEVKEDGKEEEDDLEELKYSVKNLLTPSRKSGRRNLTTTGTSFNTAMPDISNNYTAKTPLRTRQTDDNNGNKNFQTPKNVPQSSPSTVIMSLCTRGDEVDDNEIGSHFVSTARNSSAYPHSPTPSKDISLTNNSTKILESGNNQVPAMGLFSDKKKQVNTKAKNKAQMQAGMSKFQIVFTDVQTLMNNKGKKKMNNEDNQRNNTNTNNTSKVMNNANLGVSDEISPELISTNMHNNINNKNMNPNMNIPMHHGMMRSNVLPVNVNVNNTLKRDKSYDHKDMSIISGTSSTMNMSTEHTSFELSGQLSTPNSKYMLDRMFEKTSPEQKGQFGYWQQPSFSMPPPQMKQQHPQQHSTQQQSGQYPMMLMMMMSTPQHQNVIQYGSYSDILPSNDFHPDKSQFN